MFHPAGWVWHSYLFDSGSSSSTCLLDLLEHPKTPNSAEQLRLGQLTEYSADIAPGMVWSSTPARVHPDLMLNVFGIFQGDPRSLHNKRQMRTSFTLQALQCIYLFICRLYTLAVGIPYWIPKLLIEAVTVWIPEDRPQRCSEQLQKLRNSKGRAPKPNGGVLSCFICADSGLLTPLLGGESWKRSFVRFI